MTLRLRSGYAFALAERSFVACMQRSEIQENPVLRCTSHAATHFKITNLPHHRTLKTVHHHKPIQVKKAALHLVP